MQADAESSSSRLERLSHEAALAISKRRHQLASGRPAGREAHVDSTSGAMIRDASVEFHRHSIDLTAGGHFVKVNRTAYGRLIRMYRRHLPKTDVVPPCLPPARSPYLSQTARGADPTGEPPLEKGGSGHKRGEEKALGTSGVADPDDEAKAAEATASGSGSALPTTPASSELRTAPTSGCTDSYVDFHNRLFAMLLRYKSIQGHGYQAAAGPPVFDILKRRLGVGMECFASPLNAHFDRFASAFVDVDAPFGSCGSFFG